MILARSERLRPYWRRFPRKLDPFERFHEARGYDEWQENRSWTLGAATKRVGAFLQSLKDYPARMKSFDVNIDAMMNTLYESSAR